MFKVGWLLTHNFETTTILYYTVFLPGVLLHEIVYWLMAGVMNVRADRSIQWPAKQEIGELQLNFVKLSPKANPIKRAVIAATPLITGLLAIWIIGVNIFQLDAVIVIAASGSLEDIARAMGVLTGTPDFWLWFYISFTIANTMFPTIPKDMRGWWQIAGAIVVVLVALLILGIGQSVLSEISLTLVQILNSLSLTLILTIVINIIMVMLLGAIESAIERITGHSATFQKGKMVTMTREEALRIKREEHEKRLATRSTTPRRKSAASDPTTIYAFEFPIPGPPGQEPITKGVAAVLGMDKANTLPETSLEDEVIETTARDSARQRMLELFPKSEDKIPEKNQQISGDIPALPVTAQSTTEIEADVNKTISAPNEVTTNDPVFPSSIASNKEPADDGFPDEAQADKPAQDATKQSPPSLRSKINLPPTSAIEEPDNSGKSEPDEDAELRPDRVSNPINLSPSARVVKEVDPEEDESNEDESILEQPNASWRTKINLPQPAITEDIDVDADETQDDEVLPLVTRPTSRFDDVLPTTTTKIESRDKEDNEDEILAPGAFSRPFVRRDKPDFDEENEDEDEAILPDISDFQRPFLNRGATDSPEKSEEDNISVHPVTSSSWRSQLSTTPKTSDDDDDDDEQLASRLPGRSNIFDSLKTSPTTSDKTDKDSVLPRPSASSWRNQLSATPKTSDDDDDDDDEQLASRLPRRTNMFDMLDKQSESSKDDKSNSPLPRPTSSRRSPLSTTPKTSNDDDDDDDEQLASRLPKRSNIFSSLPSSSIEEDDDDEALPRTGSILSGLGRPPSQPPGSTILGSGSRAAPKPTDSPSNKQSKDWREQLPLDEEDDELSYEPVEDELAYEDIDEYDYGDDDSNFYDDDL